MSLFVRKIIKSKWYQTDIENGDDVSADAITNCMKTKQNTLSVWEIESPDELDNAVLAIVSQHQHLETIDVVKLDSVSLVENEIVWVESRGLTPIDDLIPHPRNYVEHPEDEIDHIIRSIEDNGFYKNIVIAQGNVILAGHGVHKAAKIMGKESVPCVRLDLDPDDPRALKVLAGDNEIAHLREIDDRALSEILKEIYDRVDLDLQGTGYDEKMLANLVFITRPANEIQDIDEAAHWVGMPEYEPVVPAQRITVNFRNEKDRIAFAKKLGIIVTPKTKSIWYPHKENDDVMSIAFELDESA